MKKAWSLLLVLVVISVQPEVSDAAGSKKTIAVLPFTNSTGLDDYEPLSNGIADIISSHLGRVEGIAVVERRHLERILAEQELSLRGVTDASSVARSGRLLGADLILTGGFKHKDSTLTINGHLYDVETILLLRSAAVSTATNKVVEQTLDLLAKLVEGQDLEIPSPAPGAVDESPVANLHFIRGLGHLYVSLYDEAIAEFMRALSLEPDLADARFWIARCYFMEEEWAHALVELQAFLDTFPTHGKRRRALEMAEIAQGRLTDGERALLEDFNVDVVGSVRD